jgi:hypothetical protein
MFIRVYADDRISNIAFIQQDRVVYLGNILRHAHSFPQTEAACNREFQVHRCQI